MATSNGGGHLVYINNGTLFAVPFDLNALEVRGTPVPLLDEVTYNPNNGSAQFDFSHTGMLLYRSGGTAGSGQVTVQWLDSEGKTQPLLAKPDSYLRPSLSPDGTRLAIAISDVWVYNWQRDTMTRLTFGAKAIGPIWSPDGRYILFQEPGGMFWTRSDGSGKPQSLTQSNNAQVPWSITADGKWLAFHEVNQTSISIWSVALENDGTGLRAGKSEPFSQTQFDEWSQKRIANVGLLPNYGLAPDGKHIAALMPVETPEAQKSQKSAASVLKTCLE